MTVSLLRLGVAYLYTSEIVSQDEAAIAEDLKEFMRKTSEDFQRDFERPASILLPLCQTPKRLTSQLTEAITLVTKARKAAQKLVGFDLCSITMAIILTLLFVIVNPYISRVLVMTSPLQKVTQLAITILLVVRLNPIESREFSRYMPINIILLTVISYYEINAQFFEGIESSAIFGTSQLTNYLLLVKGVSELLKVHNRIKQREEKTLASQAVINKVASVIFNQQKVGVGLGILHLSDKDQLSMVRYNDRFLQLLSLDSELRAYDDESANVQDKESVASCLEDYYLYRDPHEEDSHKLFKKLSFRAMLVQEIQKLSGSEGEEDQSLTDSAALLFKDNFYCINSDELRSDLRQSQLLQRRLGRSIQAKQPILEIKLHILNQKDRLFLVRLNQQPKCPRLQIFTCSEQPRVIEPENPQLELRLLDKETKSASPSKKKKIMRRIFSTDLIKITNQVVPSQMPKRASSGQIPDDENRTNARNARRPVHFPSSEGHLSIGNRSASQRLQGVEDMPSRALLKMRSQEEESKVGRVSMMGQRQSSAKSTSSNDLHSNLIHKVFKTRPDFLRLTEQQQQVSGQNQRQLKSQTEVIPILPIPMSLLQKPQSNLPSSNLSYTSQNSLKVQHSQLLKSSTMTPNQSHYFTQNSVDLSHVGGSNHGVVRPQQQPLGSRIIKSQMPDQVRRRSNFSGKLVAHGSAEPARSARICSIPRNHLAAAGSDSQGSSSKKAQKSKLFFFKIIHDLRHPTQAVKEGLGEIIENAGSLPAKINFGAIKGLKYTSDPRTFKVLKHLEKYTRQLSGNFIRDQKQRASSISLVSHYSKQQISENSVISHEKQRAVDQNFEHNFEHKLKKLQKFFWELPVENFKKAKLRKQSLFEVKGSLGLSNSRKDLNNLLDDDPNQNQCSVSVSLEENEDDDLDCVSEKLCNKIQTETKSETKRKDFSRKNLHVVAKVKELSLTKGGIKSKYAHGSLATEKLIIRSDLAQRAGIFDIRSLHSNSESFEFPSLSSKSLIESASSPSFPVLSSELLAVRSSSSSDSIQADQSHRSGGSEASSQNHSFRNFSQLLPRISSIPVSKNRKRSNLELIRESSNPLNNGSRCLSDRDSTDRKKLGKLVHHLLNERHSLIFLVENLLRKRNHIKKQSQTLQANVEMMSTLLQDLMNLAMLNNNTFKFIDDYFDFNRLVKRCFKVFRVQCNLKDVTMKGPIFEQPLDRFYFKAVFGDENRYRQIIINFLSNGVKFTPSCGTVSVHLRAIMVKDIPPAETKIEQTIATNDDAESSKSAPDKGFGSSDESSKTPRIVEKLVSFALIFRDSGCGISEENQKKLFSNFGKLEASQEVNKQGVGLGLSICRDIINASGGSVDIHSKSGIGTDFIISLQAKCRVNKDQIAEAAVLLEQQFTISDDSDELSSEPESLREDDYDQGFDLQSQDLELSQASAENYDQVVASNRNNNNPFRRQLSIIHESRSNSMAGSSIEDNDQYQVRTACIVANDCAFVLDSICRILSRYFQIVHRAENGQTAVEMVESQSVNFYQAIILDIDMPVLNGIQACEKILKYLRQARVDKLKRMVHIANCEDDQVRSAKQQAIQVVPIIPLVYALTQESSEEVFTQIKNVGFKAKMHQMTKDEVKLIMQNAGLQFKPIKREERDPSVRKGSSSSSSYLPSSDSEEMDQSEKKKSGELRWRRREVGHVLSNNI